MQEKDIRSLHEQIEADRKELFNLKLNLATGQVKDVSQFKKLRQKIARALTQLRVQEQSAPQNEHKAS